MRVLSSVSFNKFFLLDNGQAYPYSRLHPTRNTFFCKWIMQKGQSNMGLTYYFPTMANSLRATLLDAIAFDGAKPFPPQASAIMDDMFWWGKTVNFQWYEQVVDSLGWHLDTEEDMDVRIVVRQLIGFRVEGILHENFDVDSMLFDLLFNRYSLWFDWTYRAQDFNNKFSFRRIAETSFNYIEWCIVQVEYASATPATEATRNSFVTPERRVNSA
jgi:hypothetical protein